MTFKRICAYPDCGKEGEFPAPRDAQKLGQRIYFCLEHVKEYNKHWNGLEGLSSDEIFTMQQGGYWNRPTWKMGVGSHSYKSATIDEKITDPYRVFGEHMRQQDTHKPEPKQDMVPGQIRKACQTLGISTPRDLNKVKTAYRQLAKKYHPDLHQNAPDAVERIQRINDAYKILLTYAQRQK